MENSISKMRPELVKEWSEKNAPLTPELVPFGSNKLYWWHGICGHEWQTSSKARSHGENCPICNNTRIIPGINDLESLEPELAKEWSKKNPTPASAVGVGSHKKAIWKGRCGHEWSAVIRNRVAGAGCPYCSHNIVLSGFNDLETLFPEVAKEWAPRNLPLKPSQVTAYSNRKVWWQCEHGHEWYTLISTCSYGSKCPYCSGIKLLKGFNDFATLHPGLALEWSERNGSLTPDSVNEKSNKNVWWHCSKCGNEYKAVLKSRVRGYSARCVLKEQFFPGTMIWRQPTLRYLLSGTTRKTNDGHRKQYPETLCIRFGRGPLAVTHGRLKYVTEQSIKLGAYTARVILRSVCHNYSLCCMRDKAI